ncbi:MAG TPA: prenyltransferase [Candidatus Bathyarchaeota archaeon]|nr:prenyltransferase [Candidatus Bathyarchaeota archaeon]
MSLNIILETRPKFLLLSVVQVAYGSSIAFYHGAFSVSKFLLTLTGVLLAHISVNVLNDYFDFKSGIDLETRRTPFSGGSGLIPSGVISPETALKIGVSSLLGGIAIGSYLAMVSGFLVIPLMLIGAASTVLYSPLVARVGIGELVTGLNFGPLMVIGSYYVQMSDINILVIAASLIPGFLVFLLLLLNEFPDVEPDRKAGRINIPIMLGLRKASKIYTLVIVFQYLYLIFIVFLLEGMPKSCLLGLLTVPLAFKTIKGVNRAYGNVEELVKYMGLNIAVVLLTPTLITIGFIIS